MATKAYSSFFAAGTNVPAGTTRAAPVVSSVVQTDGYGGDLSFRITNSGALNAPCTVTFQISATGGTNASEWFDYYSVYSGDLLSGTVNQGNSPIAPRGAKFQRAIAYGNTNSACTVEGGIHQVTAL